MSDEQEENLAGDVAAEANFDDFDSKQNTLGDLWRSNPMVKVGVIFAAGAAILGTMLLFGGEKEQPTVSYVSGGADVTATPGTDEASQKYVKAIEEFNEAEVEQAYATGGSALPVPIDPPKGRINLPEEEEEQEDPLQRWRRLQEERLQREIKQQETIEPLAETGESAAVSSEAVQAMADLMAQQMQQILDSKSEEKTVSSLQITDADFMSRLNEKINAAQQEAMGIDPTADPTADPGAGPEGGGDGEFVEESVEEVLIPAGSIEYGQLIIEANTDTPGPVLAMIASGPLRGSRLIGTFTEENELITLNFSTVVVDGVSQPVNAIALDPKTTLSGMATDVDHRYFERVLLPMAAAFVEGAAEAISNSGLTTVTVDGGAAVSSTEETDTKEQIASGIEEAGQELSSIIDETADQIKVKVVIAPGTRIGILFIDSVVENSTGASDG